MSTSSPFFNDCVDFEGTDAFSADFPPHDTTSVDGNPHTFAYADEYGAPVYQQVDGTGQRFEANPYGEFSPLELDPGYDSTTATTRTSTTPNTQASTRTTSVSESHTESASSSSKSRSHRHRHSPSGASVEPPASSSSGSKKKKGGKGSSKSKSHEVEEEAKRTKFLERNRLAASKCRQKKKEWVSGLEDQKAGLESKHSHLQMEYNGLLGEVSGLKEELMNHANCNDPNINQWLENEARKFVQQTSDKLSGVQSRKGSGSKRHASISPNSPYHSSGAGANIDPMLRNGVLQDDMTFSPTDEADSAFEHASSMFGPSQ